MRTNNGSEDSQQKLLDVAIDFFSKLNFEITEKVSVKGLSGKKHSFDLKIKLNNGSQIDELLVKIVDWKRAVGVDRLIRFERLQDDLNGKKALLVSNSFSGTSEKYAKRRGLLFYSREHLQFLDEEDY